MSLSNVVPTGPYVYIWRDPRRWLDGKPEPFYVGKGRGRRAWALAGHAARNNHYINRMKKIRQSGYEPICEVIPMPTEERALALEMMLVAFYGRRDLDTGTLTNHTNGGDKPPVHRGDSHPCKRPEVRAKLSSKLSGSGNPQYGHPSWNAGLDMGPNPQHSDRLKAMGHAPSMASRSNTKGSYWYNDGEHNIRVHGIPPSGYTRGRLFKAPWLNHHD